MSLQLRSEGPWHARKWQSFRGWSDWHHLSSLLPCHRRSPTLSSSPIQCLDRVILNCDGHQKLLSKKLITWRFDPPEISQEIPKKWKRPQHHSCGCLTAKTAIKKNWKIYLASRKLRSSPKMDALQSIIKNQKHIHIVKQSSHLNPSLTLIRSSWTWLLSVHLQRLLDNSTWVKPMWAKKSDFDHRKCEENNNKY